MTTEAFVVSDLHLGAGAAEPELEDFDQDEQLAAFVERIARPGVSLFINGDFIDFPQIPPYEVGPEDHLLWDEASSLAKLEMALLAHSKPFEALGRFVANGGALRLHVGNHDLDLAWPKVQERLRAVVGAGLQLSNTHSVYHGVHIEHGHMFTPENAPKMADSFIHAHSFPDGSEKTYLERVWGTDFMLQFYNDLERKHRFADNVKPMLTVLYYGIKNRWVGAKDLVRLVLFLKRSGIEWRGVASSVLAGPPGEQKVPESVQDEDWRHAIGERMATDVAFRKEMRETIAALPPEQQELLADGRTVKIEVAGAKSTTQAGNTLGLFREERQHRAARQRLESPGITHVVFGHTHEVIDGELDGCLFNPGTWLPHLDFGRADVEAKIKANGLTLAMLGDPALFLRERTVVHIVADPTGRSRVKLVNADDVD